MKKRKRREFVYRLPLMADDTLLIMQGKKRIRRTNLKMGDRIIMEATCFMDDDCYAACNILLKFYRGQKTIEIIGNGNHVRLDGEMHRNTALNRMHIQETFRLAVDWISYLAKGRKARLESFDFPKFARWPRKKRKIVTTTCHVL